MDCRSSYSRLHLLLNLRHSILTHQSIPHEKLRKYLSLCVFFLLETLNLIKVSDFLQIVLNSYFYRYKLEQKSETFAQGGILIHSSI